MAESGEEHLFCGGLEASPEVGSVCGWDWCQVVEPVKVVLPDGRRGSSVGG